MILAVCAVADTKVVLELLKCFLQPPGPRHSSHITDGVPPMLRPAARVQSQGCRRVLPQAFRDASTEAIARRVCQMVDSRRTV
jgi:hypothetical protein